MKILFYQWKSFLNEGIERALRELEYPYDILFYQQTDWEQDDVFLEKLREKIRTKEYDKVFSVNFAPLVAEVCEEFSVEYICWIYDSPIHIRNLDTLKYKCSRIYCFDREQTKQLKALGANAIHLPLATDVRIWEETLSKETAKKVPPAEISLVGNLYQTDYAYFTRPLDEYVKGYLEGIVSAQLKIYGGYLIPELVTDALLEKMNACYRRVASDGFLMGRRELEFLLASEVTGRERYLALSLLSAHFPVDLYSTKQDERLKNVEFRGYADYQTTLPAVFAKSRINLNISLKTICSGIPLRVIECMGCGGFVLTNYQEEILEHFVPGEECVVYENLEDLYEKAAFYLAHEEERKRIAQAGYERICRDFSMKDRIQKMLG